MQSIITPGNWTYARFESGPYRAFISFGADPDSLEKGQYLYYATVTEGEDKEIHQEVLPTLSAACETINRRYAEWQFVDQSAPKSGCGTCVAH
jgi:hypothetical protein